MTIHRTHASPDSPAENVADRILTVRGHRVLLDVDLAVLYGVDTRTLNQAVRRNRDRFPKDFLLVVLVGEVPDLISQTVTSSWGGRRKSFLAFTEQGVAMLSGVLRSKRAVQVNIAIMRAFVQLRRWQQGHEELARQLEQLELRVAHHDEEITAVFEAIRQLLRPPPEPPRPRIGFDRGHPTSTRGHSL